LTQQRAEEMMNTYDHFKGFKFNFESEFFKDGRGWLATDGITEEEDKFIRMVWTLMEDGSYYDAVRKISEGL
jgi:hypothetical protein